MANDAANANMVLNPELVAKYNTHPEELGGKKQLDQTKSFERYEESKKWLPGGLTGVRNPKAMIEGEYPIFIERGKGSHMWDVDGNEYIDLLAGYGPTTIGMAIDEIDQAAIERIAKGINFSLSSDIQIELAQKIKKHMPYAERSFFCKTGTDATTIALRLARAYTGKEYVLTDGYHGWQDSFQYGEDAGVLNCVREKTKHITFGDYEGYEAAVKEGNVACIMITPYMALPMRITKVDYDFVRKIRKLCDEYEIPLIFDEVRTAFRFSLGGCAELIGVEPDMTAFAKAFANGYSIAAVVGKAEYMENMIIWGKPGGTYISSTYFPNCLEMAVASKVIDFYEENDVIGKIHESGKYLVEGMKKAAEAVNAPVLFDEEPTMPSMMFDIGQMTEEEYYARTLTLYTYIVRCGILIHPFRQIYVTYSLTKEDLDRVIEAYTEGLKIVKEKYPW